METDTLNEKLAEWAGFKWHKKRQYVHGYMMHGGSWHEGHWDYNGECWYETLDHERGCFSKGQLPDFTNSLDAGFKWLVPKAREKGYRIFITTSFINDPLYYAHAGVEGFSDDNPALGLGLAVEKLIDGGK